MSRYGLKRHLVATLVALCALNTLAEPLSVVDFSGKTVTLEAPATRIVALAPHSVENLFSAGAGDKLVGAVSGSDFPDAARDIPRVGSFNAYSLETIASVEPDLIIIWGSGNGTRTLAKLETLGIPVFVSEPRQLADIPRDIRALGILAGTTQDSEIEAQRIEQALAELARRYSQKSIIRVMYEVWNDPLQTINGDHLISQVITLCAGNNIFANVETLAPRINVESVLALAPEAIIASGIRDTGHHWLDDWQRYPTLHAVRDGGLFFVNPDYLERPTARVLLGAQSVCEQLDSLRSSASGTDD